MLFDPQQPQNQDDSQGPRTIRDIELILSDLESSGYSLTETAIPQIIESLKEYSYGRVDRQKVVIRKDKLIERFYDQLLKVKNMYKGPGASCFVFHSVFGWVKAYISQNLKVRGKVEVFIVQTSEYLVVSKTDIKFYPPVHAGDEGDDDHLNHCGVQLDVGFKKHASSEIGKKNEESPDDNDDHKDEEIEKQEAMEEEEELECQSLSDIPMLH